LLPALHRVTTGLVRRTWLLVLVTMVVCAGFAAHALAALDEAERLTAASEAAGPAVRPARPVASARIKLDGSGLVARNIFCSACEPSRGGVPGVTASYQGEPAVLIATMVGRDPRATVRVLASDAQGSWGIGERIPGVGVIERIGGASIDVLDAAGQRGTLSLLDASAGARGPGAATPEVAAPAADPFADRVKQLGDGTFEVDRNLVRELVSGSTKPGGVRVVPVVSGTDVKGVRLLGVRGGSVAAALGLKSNDLISAIDGQPIKNAQQLLDLYAKLDQVSAVELAGTRAGKPLTLTLRLR
ncbi:MAG: PDZ domain-containing protein, partial [Myxococcota bacterium]|nr:PDZ domain-containing protein [Myxococcota bacterium]